MTDKMQQRYEAIVRSIEGVLWESFVNTFEFTFVSEKAENLLEYPSEQWVSEKGFWLRHLHPEDRMWVAKYFQETAKKRESFELEYRMIAKDGRTVWMHDFVSIESVNERPYKFRGVKIDISASKHTEQTLRRKFDELNTLHYITRITIEATKEDQLIEQVTQTIGETLYPDHFGILLLDGQKERLHPHPSYRNQKGGLALQHSIPIGEGIIGGVAATGKSLLINDIATHPDYVFRDPKTKSELCVPLTVGGRVIGAINVESQNENTFSTEDERFLSTLSRYVALAIERLRNDKEERTWARQLKLIHEVSRKISMVLDVDDILPKIPQLIVKSFGYYHVVVALVEGDKLIFGAGAGQARFEPGSPIPLGEGITGTAAKLQKSLLIADVSREPLYILDEAVPEVKAELAVPLIISGKTIGLIDITSNKINGLSEQDKALMDILGGQVATAIHNAQLFKSIQPASGETAPRTKDKQESTIAKGKAQQTRFLKHLQNLVGNLSLSLTSSNNIQELLDALPRELTEMFEADTCIITLWDPEHELAIPAAAYNLKFPYPHLVSPRPGETTLTQLCLREMRVIAVDETTRSDYISDRLAEKSHMKSMMGIPLFAGDENLGAVIIAFYRPHNFSEAEIRLGDQIGTQISLGLARVRMYEETKKDADQLTIINKIFRTTTGATDMREVCRLALDEILVNFEYTQTAVYLFNTRHKVLEASASRSQDARLQRSGYRVEPPEGGIVYRSALRGTHLLSETSPLSSEILNDENVLVFSKIAIPLRLRGQVWGVLALENTQNTAIDEKEIPLLLTIAEQLALALEKTQLLEETQKRAGHLEALNAIISGTSTATRIQDLLGEILKKTLEALNLNSGALWIRDAYVREKTSLKLLLAAQQHFERVNENKTINFAIENWDTKILPKAQNMIRDVMLNESFRATLVIPIKSEGETIGGLMLLQKKARRWPQEEIMLGEAICSQLGDTTYRLELFEETQSRAHLMDRLASLSEALNRSFTVSKVIETIGEGALALGMADRAAVFYRNEESNLECPWSHGLEQSYLDNLIIRSKALPKGWLLAYPEPVLIEDLVSNPTGTTSLVLPGNEHFRALALWPLRYEEKVVASVGCFYDSPRAWPRAEREVMEAFARQAAIAFENARLFEQLEDSYLDTVLALARTIDARDNYTGDHSKRLAVWATAIAQKMECTTDQIRAIHWGALLHDIGKIAVPDEILYKPGPLTPDEWVIMKKHPEYGAEIVTSVKKLADVRPLIRSHQEKFDGTGYPDGLAGENIPLGARILTVVDSYSAMIDDRIYRKAMSHEAAIDELKRMSGRQFDPDVVVIFLDIIDHFRQNGHAS